MASSISATSLSFTRGDSPGLAALHLLGVEPLPVREGGVGHAAAVEEGGDRSILEFGSLADHARFQVFEHQLDHVG